MKYQAKQTGNQSAELLLYGDVGIGHWGEGFTAKQIGDDLKSIGRVSELTVGISSAGGLVTEGLAIFNLLRHHAAHITTRVDSVAASIASVIFMAGDSREMMDNSMLMIHNARGIAAGEVVAGETRFLDFVKKAKDDLETANDQIVSIYDKATGSNLSERQIRAMMTEETLIDSSEALDMGFTDRRTEAFPMAAMADFSRFEGVGYDKLREAMTSKPATNWQNVGSKPAGKPTLRQAAKLANLQLRVATFSDSV